MGYLGQRRRQRHQQRGTLTVSGTGTDLQGQYFDNSDFTNLKLTRTDATVNFNWGTGSPHSSIGADTFSVRWTGQVQPQYSETYTFYVTHNDGRGCGSTTS